MNEMRKLMETLDKIGLDEDPISYSKIAKQAISSMPKTPPNWSSTKLDYKAPTSKVSRRRDPMPSKSEFMPENRLLEIWYLLDDHETREEFVRQIIDYLRDEDREDLIAQWGGEVDDQDYEDEGF